MKLLHTITKYHLIFLGIWLLLILIINPLGDFSLNDSWRYAHAVKSLIEKGRYELGVSFAPNIFFQVIWGYVFCYFFGFSYTVLRFSTLVITFFGILFFYELIKKISNSIQISFILTLLLILNPLFLSLSFSFMTDTPFLSISVMAFYFFYNFSLNEKPKELIIAIVLSTFAFLIRQPGILYAFLFAISYFIFKKANRKSVIILFIVSIYTIILYIGVEQLKVILNVKESYLSVSSDYIKGIFETPLQLITQIITNQIKPLIYIGLFSLPILIFIKFPRFNHKLWHLVIFSINLLVLFGLLYSDKIFPFAGNVIRNVYIGPSLFKNYEALEMNYYISFSKEILILINFIGQISGTYLFIIVMKYIINKFTVFNLFLLGVSSSYLLSMSSGGFFDRYSLLPFALTLIFLSNSFNEILSTKYKIIHFLILLPILWFSIAGTRDYLNLHRTKKLAFEYLLTKNVSVAEMDAGQEIQGRYNSGKDVVHDNTKSWWWVTDDEYVITIGEIENYTVIKKFEYFSLLQFNYLDIYVLERNKISKTRK